MGEHPDFSDIPATVFGDAVHPNDAGHDRMYDSYRAAMDTLLDTTRESSAGPYEAVWDAFAPLSDLAVGSTITRRVIVSGLAWEGHDGGVSVTGAGSPSVEINGAAPSGRVYNGDALDLTLTASASYETGAAIDLTIGGETRTLTFTTGADVAPAEYLHGDITGVAEGDTSLSLTGLAFASGIAVVFVPTGTTALASDAVKLNGVALTKRQRTTTAFNGCIEIWDGPVAAGSSHAITVTYPAWRGNRFVSYGTVTDGSFSTATGNAPGGEADPHLTPSVTVPANGIALSAFLEYGARRSLRRQSTRQTR